MTKIKFRAWDKENKTMLTMSFTEDLIWMSGNVGNNSLTVPFRHAFDKDKFELMQYTGLKDKNGKEIYENDIVSYMEDLSNPKVVEYGDGYFYPLAAFKTDSAIEVIGNVYQNPELINGGRNDKS